MFEREYEKAADESKRRKESPSTKNYVAIGLKELQYKKWNA
jgi:hypothetical protein